MATTLVWFRNDLRIDDHPALHAASSDRVVCVFVLDDASEARWPMGEASRWWLHRSLAAHAARLESLGATLILRRGDAASQLGEIARRAAVDRVVAIARVEPAALEQERAVRRTLERIGVRFDCVGGALLHDPSAIRTGSGAPYKVFTPFWKACLAHGFDEVPVRAPASLDDAGGSIRSDALDALGLEPRVAWDEGLRAEWTPGEQGARKRWSAFVRTALRDYADGRDRCPERGTSMLSPHLHFGEISVRRLWHELHKAERSIRAEGPGGVANRAAIESLRTFRSELGWREFAHHVLAAFPETPEEPLRPEFARFPWRPDAARLRAWQRGRTGHPLVDAGMRQLWTTGWMHNRVRMVAASFLVKHLLQPWQQGARWFWNTLVDADQANNTMGWQWSAGCGADAAPYFRIFNPVSQGEKFDAQGEFVRRWVPELARLPDKWIHRPWGAPRAELDRAGVVLGDSYPAPIVDHAEARQAALDAFAALRSAS